MQQEKIKLEEIPEPVGAFIMAQPGLTPLVTANGYYWHYKDVVTLLTRYAAAQHSAGCEWVKCSDRLPGHKRRVRWRDGNDHYNVTKGEISLFEMDKPNLEGWEWYDESPSKEGKPKNEFVEILDNALDAGKQVLDELRKQNSEKGGNKQINCEWVNNALVEFALSYHQRPNKDIANDAAEYLHDKLKDAGIEYVLCEEEKEGSKEREESEAIKFHDWAINNAWELDHREEHTHTTAELYELFKQNRK
jgi:hypothetical protein